MNKPKLLFLSTNDKGGAGWALLKEVELLRNFGCDATLIVCNKYSDSDACLGLIKANTRIGKIKVFINHVIYKFLKIIAFRSSIKKYIMFDIQLSYASAKQILSLYGNKPDIIMIGWVTDFVSAKTVKDLKTQTGAKIIYYMTDNAPIGGGCHYPWDCDGYTRNCYPCPALKANNHRAEKTFLKKKKYITEDMFICGTTNDINRASHSLIFKNNPKIIAATLNTNPYSFSKDEGRSFFNIDSSKYVIFCGADSVASERKGFKELISSLDKLSLRIDVSNIVVLVAGNGKMSFPEKFNVKCVGKLSFEDLFKAYACADLFVCPSLEDSGPMMINYGVMSYIPVVCFEMGVALDVIQHKQNGYIAKWRDTDDFALGMQYCIQNLSVLGERLYDLNNSIMKKTQEEKSLWKSLGIV